MTIMLCQYVNTLFEHECDRFWAENLVCQFKFDSNYTPLITLKMQQNNAFSTEERCMSLFRSNLIFMAEFCSMISNLSGQS